MSGDEGLVFFLAVVLTFVGLRGWYVPLAQAMRARRVIRPLDLWLVVLPLIGYLIVLGVLLRWSDPQVRADAGYLALFVLLSSGWWLGTWQAAAFLGIRYRDDMVGRRDPAAMLTLSSALLATAITYAGANIGTGDTIWTTIVPAIAATLILLLAWLLVELATVIADAITLDGDLAAALRLSGFLLGSGLILGRAAAGNFHSWPETFCDLALQGWPVLVLAVTVIVLQRFLRPTPEHLRPSPWIAGVLPAGLLLLLAGAWLVHLGWWR